MATLLLAVTANGKGTGAAMTGPCTVYVYGTFGGASVSLDISDDDATYVKADNVSTPSPAHFTAAGCVTINALGTYYVRAGVAGASSTTSLTAKTTQ